MPGIHSLEHIQRLAAARFTYHNPVRAHPQGIDDQLADGHFSLPLDIWRTFF
jgi:hypothetical protein